jgi:hypothetical protein
VTPAAGRAPRSAASTRVFPAGVMTTTENYFSYCLLFVLFVSAVRYVRALILPTIARRLRRSLSAAMAYGTAPRLGSGALGSLPVAGSRAKAAARDFSVVIGPFFTPQKNQKNRDDCSKAGQLPLVEHLRERAGSVFSPVGLGRLLREVRVGAFFVPPGVALRQQSAG